MVVEVGRGLEGLAVQQVEEDEVVAAVDDDDDEAEVVPAAAAAAARVWYWWWSDEEEVRRPVQERRLRIAAAWASGARATDDGAAWCSVCIDALRRWSRPVQLAALLPATEAAGILGLGDADPSRLALVLRPPLAVRALRGETPGPNWWWRAPDDGARGLGRRWCWSARVGRWFGSPCVTAEGMPCGCCGMWIIRPPAAKLLSSVPGGAGYSKLCWCCSWMARLSVALRALAAAWKDSGTESVSMASAEGSHQVLAASPLTAWNGLPFGADMGSCQASSSGVCSGVCGMALPLSCSGGTNWPWSRLSRMKGSSRKPLTKAASLPLSPAVTGRSVGLSTPLVRAGDGTCDSERWKLCGRECPDGRAGSIWAVDMTGTERDSSVCASMSGGCFAFPCSVAALVRILLQKDSSRPALRGLVDCDGGEAGSDAESCGMWMRGDRIVRPSSFSSSESEMEPPPGASLKPL
ncbi:7646a53d-33a2-43f2-bedf-af68558fd314 [Thermothielavioides terrestris]|uniref:7646a53d-33a2-43f2-bedf-af68558fd314 n=1 Tax=Thermothielavioides terrestris TaxID=2587410 RepID=A0A446BI25_9PEZI|nr:7646a53d-33a2-43f2-bedf-af68558fd314 [Thermothielavioides terrestris]